MINSSDAKAAIFESIRRNLAASAPFDAVRGAHHDFCEDVVADHEVIEKTLIEQFRESFEAVGGHFFAVDDENAAANVLASIIAKENAKNVAISDAELVRVVVEKIEDAADFVQDADASELFLTDLGITSAQWAIAETGTLVLENDRERNRLTSLVPPVHVCILDASKIRKTLGEVLGLLQKDLSRTVTFVTGASRTSDIELTLAIGVHGPGELYVIAVGDQ